MDIYVEIKFKDGLHVREVCQQFSKNAHALMLKDGFETSVFELKDIEKVNIETFKGL
tara:strand:+ start:23458 stop:23628 length:171 start_codon:yes stop_codon:yes gene_type:complete